MGFLSKRGIPTLRYVIMSVQTIQTLEKYEFWNKSDLILRVKFLLITDSFKMHEIINGEI